MTTRALVGIVLLLAPASFAGASPGASPRAAPEDSPDGTIFSPPVELVSLGAPRQVAHGDLDGDGDEDLAYAAVGEDTIGWIRNTDGLGTFGPKIPVDLKMDGAWSVDVDDLDGDGDNDLLACAFIDGVVTWYENLDGFGDFGPRQLITTAVFWPRSVEAADLDGDGDLDVLSASFFDFKIAWYENLDGLGTFGPQTIIALDAFLTEDATTDDLDGDGDLDVIAAIGNSAEVVWYRNNGAGSFAEQPPLSTTATSVFMVNTGDVDGDGDNDVLSASLYNAEVAWYPNDGTGGFSGQVLVSGEAGGAWGVDTGDYDLDGDLDACFVAAGDGKIVWHENVDGLGNFGTAQLVDGATLAPSSVVSADFDADGDLDLGLSVLGDNQVSLSFNSVAAAPSP